MNTTLLFDYGGTLDTSACHWFYVFQNAYTAIATKHIEEHNLREAYVMGERALAKQRIVMPSDTFYDMLVKKVSIQVDHLENVLSLLHFSTAEEKNSFIKQIASSCDDFARKHAEQSAHVLAALKPKYKLIMVSNFYGNLHAVLQAYGLNSFFSDVIESSVVGVRKPDPAIWQLGVEAAHCDASSCVAIGDSYNKDIVPAASIGCQTVWFKGKEWEEKAFDETLPTHIIERLDDILKYY